MTDKEKNKLLNASIAFGLWIFAIFILTCLIDDLKISGNILLTTTLAAFFFSLTTSPITWIIKAFGLEVGSNSPDHIHFEKKFQKNGETVKISIRDYKNQWSREKISNEMKNLTKNA